MAYTTPIFSSSNTEGVDLSTAVTITTTTPEYPLQPIMLGTQVLTDYDGSATYVQAATATISKGDVCTISTAFVATQTPATASLGLPVGVALATATTGQYFWVQTNGVCNAVSVVNGIAANTLLYTSATAGRLAGTATGFSRIQGIVLGTTSGGTAGTYQAFLVSPSVATSQ